MPESDELIVGDLAAWRDWLADHHEEPNGIWLVLAKKGTTEPTSLTYRQALREALRWGWIDGQMARRDEATYCHRFTPRRVRSPWSVRNRETAEQLIAEGLMESSGLREIERARADGRWENVYVGGQEPEMPKDFADALEANPPARAMFDILTKANRSSMLNRVVSAKRPETRERRVKEFIEMLARGETLFPQKRGLEN